MRRGTHPVPVLGAGAPHEARSDAVSVGVDWVEVARIEASVQQFGERFLRRLFTEQELHEAHAVPRLFFERLAARFAAKEAAIKALNLSDEGVNWRDMEVCAPRAEACTMRLSGRAAAAAARSGLTRLHLSVSHSGDVAMAVLTASRI